MMPVVASKRDSERISFWYQAYSVSIQQNLLALIVIEDFCPKGLYVKAHC